MAYPSAAHDEIPSDVLRLRQLWIALLLFGGYAALYFCRANLSVATPLIADELHARGMSRESALTEIGAISSFGVLAYAAGKLLLTGIADLWGGRRGLCLSLAGAVFFTVLFTLGGGLPLFSLAWIGNRLTQSIGWASLLKVCSRWFDFNTYGRIVGILSLSYLIGDAAARQSMGMLIGHGVGWRTVFLYGAAVAALLLVVNLLFLRESRADAGHPPARSSPISVFADEQQAPRSLPSLLLPLLRNGAFLLVCALSLGCTVVRESFNTWTPTYLHEAAGFSVAGAAKGSALFPFVGAVSVLLVGWLSDRMGATGRAAMLGVGMLACTAALAGLAGLGSGTPGMAILAVTLIGVTAFALLGPYSSLGGAMALDFGGSQAGAAASGIIDGVGYLGGVLAGVGVPVISAHHGWRGVYLALALVCLLSAAAAVWLYQHQRLQLRRGMEAN